MISFYKHHFYYSVALLLSMSIAYSKEQASLVTVVKELHKPALDLPSEVAQPAIISEKDKKNLKLQINLLAPDQITLMAYDLYEKYLQPGHYLKTETDPTFLNKMELFAGGEHKKDSLLNKIDNTKTSFGTMLLALQLAQPTYDSALLTTRQELIKAFIDNPTLTEKIKEQLAIMAAAEPYLFSYFEQENTVNEELFKKVYFGEWFSFLNTSPIALEASTRVGNLFSLFMATFIPDYALFSATSVDYIKNQQEYNSDLWLNKQYGRPMTTPQPSFGESFIKTIKKVPHYVKTLNPQKQAFKDISYTELENQRKALRGPLYSQEAFNDIIQKMQPQTLGDVLHMMDCEAAKSQEAATNIRNAKLTFAGVGAFLFASQAFLTYSAIKNETLKRDIANHLQTTLIAIASYFKAAKTLYELAQAHPLLASLPGLQHIANLFDANSSLSSDAKKLINLLDHNTFTGNASLFSLTGRVLAAHQLMKKVKHEFIPACAAASSFDVYYSNAELYKKFEHERVIYTFPQYIADSTTPYFNIKAFWNPGVAIKVVVANDIILGTEKPNNIILTGPNTGGKSTVIKGTLIALLLAQTIGIAPCDELVFTPFAVLNCYLNITDDLSAGVSLFKAEVLRAKALIEAVRKLTAGQFSFTIMDEVFSGTSPKEGEEAAYMFAKELGIMPNSICSIATHFPKLTDLGSTNQFKNYQVKVWKDENNNWVRPFKLEEGKSTINIAMDLLEEAGIFSR